MYSLTLQNAAGDSVITSGDILGRINFAVPSESDGSSSTYISSQIYSQAEGSFTSASNPAALILATSSSDSAPATGRLKVSSDGHFVPVASGQYDLGSPSYHFRNIYANNIIGDYSGQLDGNLDLNGYDIFGTGNITIDGNITAENFYGDLDGVIITECQNDTGSTIAEGTPVYIAGYYASNGKPLVAPADCANAAKMPAIGLLASELTTGSEGHVHVFGLAQNLPSGVTNGFSVGNTVYVDNGGGLTNVRPTGVSELVQNIGRVLKTGTNGRILVLGPGRSNDVPNSGHFEQLTVDGYTALAVDNGNVGIGTASPALAGNDKGLHIHATNFPEIKLTNDTTLSTSDDGSVIQVVNSEFRFTNREDGNNISFYAFDTGGTSRQKLLLSESSILVNGAGVNTDFQVKGENDNNALYVDASSDAIGIGVSTPNSTLHIRKPSIPSLRIHAYVGTGTLDSRADRGHIVFPNYNETVDHVKLISWGREVNRLGGMLGFNISDTAGVSREVLTIDNESSSSTFGLRTYNIPIVTTSGNVIFNTTEDNYDFTVKGDSDPELLVVDASSDKVGIGGYPDDGKLTINFTHTNDNLKDAINIKNICISTSNGNYQSAGIDLLARKIVNSGVTDTGHIIGVDAVATLDGDGNLTSAYGARTWGGIYLNQSGTVTTAWGIHPRVINAGKEGSLISDARGIDIQINGDLLNRISSDGITNAKALYIRPITHTTNKHGIYQEGSGDDNYFAGDIGLGVTSPSARLDINSNKLRLRTAKTPSSSSDTGNAGDICWDGNYIYVCVSTNTWKRSSLSTW